MLAPAQLILVRHGQTAHNLERRMQGHIDALLDDTGHEQARKLAQHLKALGVRDPLIHSSDLQRAAATAEALHTVLGGSLHRSPDLREIGLGEWEGQLYAEIETAHPELYGRFWDGDPDCCAPGGETPQQCGDRVLRHLERHWPAAGQTVIVVSHGIAVGAALTRLLGLDYQQTFRERTLLHLNTAYSTLTLDPQTREIRSTVLAQSGHLDS
ncbi:putative Phosphoglycerate mutase (PGAM)(Phosphoglycerate phosphomutase)(Phosphoglyceromutase) [Deinococcus deserti VCD115]|uniref:Putative Phosphoglycerate mutase (PGAM)(Phosphoglycerate phosphomutase)(Phosphoglyceromutase) n=1 Tax=Deinococcus deserti (strain DSM 17065 / CIP 109153 / LMG 22923 / VCD115) TaxID=546414 RepID=C1CWL6_DEIDV|nr:putative Phosphoglycerate mutase (PGAM)(Phosphoglycerate phosphomutase)(Phosphoglyceromutase) [Deinococcus deserti VCD115]